MAVAGLTAWALWPDPPRQREYVDATACLLTDEKGITTEPARAVWATLQQASVTTLVRAQYLQVNGPQTADNAAAHLASLTSGRCGLVAAVGRPQIKAVTDNAAQHPDIRFITVGGGSPAGNIQVFDVASPDDLQKAVTDHLEALAKAAS
jgi:basic membrane lipoprotein Med (substrate-binding protein (PBP1-ABC) superfamily)